jgi:inhibitor of growth protein 5
MSLSTPYPNLSLNCRKDITDKTVEAMKLIGSLDENVDKLSEILDERIEKILPIKDLSTCPKEIEEIKLLKKIIEILTAKKLEISVKTYDFIDIHVKAIDAEMNAVEKALIESGSSLPHNETKDIVEYEETIGGKRKRVVAKESEVKATSSSVSEPVYCICKQVSFGDMIACDNEDCPIEWFHYPCVNLSRKPKNSWICPLCSNKRKK